jgi:hypothetical protein
MADRFNADGGAGFRANTSDFGSSVGMSDRSGAGSGETGNDVTSSAMPGSPHSSHGFRKALMKSQRSGALKGEIADGTTFGGKGFRKPNYFSQGGKRHGMHIGAGAPHVAPAEGADVGGS